MPHTSRERQEQMENNDFNGRRSVRSIGFRLSCNDHQSTNRYWFIEDEDPLPTITGVKSVSFQVGLVSLGEWVGFTSWLDTSNDSNRLVKTICISINFIILK